LVRSKKRVAELESQHRINGGAGINQGNSNNLGYNIASNNQNNKWDQHGLAGPPPPQQQLHNNDDNSRKVTPSISNDQHDHIMLENTGNDVSFDNNNNNNTALSQSSGSKRKMQLSNDVGQYQHNVVVAGNSDSVGSGGDSLKQRLAKHLLNREEMGCYSLPLPTDHSTDKSSVGDVSSSSMVVEVGDKASENNDKDSGDTSLSLQLLTKVNKTLQKQDVSISNETQTFVKSILYQMVDAPEHNILTTGTSSQDDNLSVSGLMNVLLLRFNSLFHRLSTNKKEGCATLDGDGDHIMTENNQSKQFDHQRMVLKLLEDSSSSSSEEGQVVVTYTTSSWRAVLYLLRVLHDILVLSGNARDDLRWWFYQARQQSSSPGDGSSGGREGRSNSPSSEHGGRDKDGTVSHPRIEGLNVIKQSNICDRKEVLWTKSCQSSSSGQQQQQSWDAMTMTNPCNQFFDLLVGLMKGNISEQDAAGTAAEQTPTVATNPEQTLVQSVQLKAIDLVLALMSDAPSYDHTKDCHGNKTPYLWKFWFDSLLPSPAGSTSSDDVSSIGDFLYSWEKSDSTCSNIMLGGSGRKHSTRLLVDDTPIITIQQGSSSKPKEKKKDDKKKSKEDKKKLLQPVSIPKPQSQLSIVIKGRIIQLLSHFIKSSSSIGQTLYEIVDEETNTSLAKRILAAILDYTEEHIVPALSSSSTSSASQDMADEYLQLCSICMNFLLILSKSNEGIRLLRLQMRLESEQDMPSRWSQSAVGVVTSILDGTLSYGIRVEEDENTTSKSTSSRLSRTMNKVATQCVTLFKTLLRFVEQQREASSSPKSTTFLAITSEHRTIFQSVCQRILSHSPSTLFGPPSLLHFSEELKLDVRDLLEEIVVDESG